MHARRVRDDASLESTCAETTKGCPPDGKGGGDDEVPPETASFLADEVSASSAWPMPEGGPESRSSKGVDPQPIFMEAYVPSKSETLLDPPRNAWPSSPAPSISLVVLRSLSLFPSSFHAVGPNAASTPRNCLEINNGRTSF